MLITRKSGFTGKMHSCNIDVTFQQLSAWESGVAIQKAMPNLSEDEREFIITGITPEEWEEAFGKE